MRRPPGLETPLIISLASEGDTEPKVLAISEESVGDCEWPLRLEPLARDESGDIHARQIWYYIADDGLGARRGHQCSGVTSLRNLHRLPHPLCLYEPPRINRRTHQPQWCWNSQTIKCTHLRSRIPTSWVLEPTDAEMTQFLIRPSVCANFVVSADLPFTCRIHMWDRVADRRNQRWIVTPRPLWWKINAATPPPTPPPRPSTPPPRPSTPVE
jgi:hypothetical protein